MSNTRRNTWWFIFFLFMNSIQAKENIIDYEACRVSGNSCFAAPTCQGDGYCPEIAMSSYIIISY